MFPRGQDPHHVPVGDNGGNGEDAPAECLAEYVEVGYDILEVAGKGGTGPAEARLDFIGDHQYVVASADLAHLTQPAVGRQHDAGFALDRLHEEGGGVVVDGGFEGGGVSKRYGHESGCVGAETGSGDRVGGEADDGGRAAVEVAGADDDVCLSPSDAFGLVAPFPCDLDGRLDRFGAGVHREHRTLAAEAGEGFGVGGESVAAEGTTGQGERLELAAGGGDQTGMLMPEVQRRVAGEKVEILPAVDVEDTASLTALEDDRQWRIVVGEMGCLAVEKPPTRGHVDLLARYTFPIEPN